MEETPASERLHSASSTRDNSKSVASCRLRHGLNDNCLLHVFDYLDESDLLRLCEMDPYYKELILKWTIKSKCLNLRYPGDQRLFEAFGMAVHKLRIYSDEFAVLFETITEYCKPGQLTQIDITLNSEVGLQATADTLSQLITTAMPMFSNLRKLRYQVFYNGPNGTCTNFLTHISTTALQLRSLEVDQIEIAGNWLHNMQNLQELRIVWKYRSSLDGLVKYLNAKPDLKVFKFLHQGADVTSLFEALGESCPNLKIFHDKDNDWSHGYARFDDSLRNRYKCFSKFAHLKSVTLTTYTFCGSDLYYPLVHLASKNLVQLRIRYCASQPIVLAKEVKAEIMRRSLPTFDRLKSVEVHIPELNSEDLFDPKWTRCDLRCQFLVHFLRHTNSLQHLAVHGMSLSKIDKLLSLLPTVRVLDISQAHLLDTFKQVSNIVETVLTSPARLTRKGAFQLILKDEKKVLYFKQQSDLNSSINFRFVPRIDWSMRSKWDL